MKKLDLYEKRFIADYYDLEDKIEQFGSKLARREMGEIVFRMNCPLQLLKTQYNTMCDYLYILKARADFEGIDL